MKTALITGANGGIGIAMVKLFLESGYKVFAHYYRNKRHLDEITNKNLFVIQANLSVSIEADKLFDIVLSKTKLVNILINNAGIYNPVDNFINLNLNLLDEALNINLKTPFLLSKRFIDTMKEFKEGRIVNISSIGVKYGGSPTSMPYTISKAALESMTLSFAKEGAKYNILVNALRLGVVDTDIHDVGVLKDMNKRIDMIPLKRMAKPEEIAEYVLFLASEKSKFTTGSIMTIAGGE